MWKQCPMIGLIGWCRRITLRYVTKDHSESSLPVERPRCRVLSDILFGLGLMANALTQCGAWTVTTWIDVVIVITCFGTV